MKYRFKALFSLLMCACIVLTAFAGCTGNKKLIDFIYPFSADVNSYDPQIASTSDEFLIIENTFEGLVRTDDEGNILKGCAESWDISGDGLTYTFRLQRGLKWNINTEKYKEGENKGKFKDRRLEMLGYEFNPDITAYDFVFALRRAVAPETQSPMFASVSGIKNAVKIHNKKAPRNSLGVTATDEYTLRIELVSPDSSFLQTLSTAVAMPCNAEFFKATGGRYGLETKYTLFNGQFYVNQILEASYLLKKNDYYCGPSPATAGELTLKIADANDKTVELLEKGYYDAAFISGGESEKLRDAKGINYIPYDDTVWSVLLNTNNAVLQSRNMRKAFCTGLSKYKSDEKKYLKPAETLIPLSCKIGAQPADKLTGNTVPAQSIKKSKELWSKGLRVIDEDEITLTLITPSEMQNEARALIQGIQSGIGSIVKDENGDPLSFTLKVEALTKSELESRVSARDYDIALYPFKASTDSAEAFLGGIAKNTRTGFDTTELEKALSLAEKATDVNSKAKAVQAAENAVMQTYSIFPVIYETSYYASANGVSGVQFHAGSGRVSFVNATRKE